MTVGLPNLDLEEKLWRNGVRLVAGADEVGRGAFAGPVVSACVAYSPNIKIPSITIRDSKTLSQKQKGLANNWIRNNASYLGIGVASVAEINTLGIVKATNKAFRRAVKNCRQNIDHMIIDAFYIPYIQGIDKTKQTPVAKGDVTSLSIASASIVAKVYRDSLMIKLGRESQFNKYCWEKNKGYGTAEHRGAIVRYGISNHHRKDYVDTYLSRL